MSEGLQTETIEAVQESSRPVYIYDADTHGATRLHEVLGTTGRGDLKLRALNLPTPKDLSTTIKVVQPNGIKEYEFVNLEGEDLKKTVDRLERSGVVLKDKPLFVRVILPNR